MAMAEAHDRRLNGGRATGVSEPVGLRTVRAARRSR